MPIVKCGFHIDSISFLLPSYLFFTPLGMPAPGRNYMVSIGAGVTHKRYVSVFIIITQT